MADYVAGNLELSILGISDGAVSSINNTVKALNSLNIVLNKIQTANSAFFGGKLETTFNSIANATEKINNVGRKNASGRGPFSFLDIAKWTSVFYMGKRLGRVVSNIAQEGANYTETLNLWETAMGDNLNLATKFVDKMNEAYGISERTLMNAQATFKNMLGSLGNISEEMSYILSEGVTQMAVDYASLYNQTFEQAFTKFQAALAGQVRPIRSVSGFDITENTLYQLYQQLGGTKTMRQLNRTEKQLLSIYAIFQQMQATGAVGDLSKTMDSYANQSRVMAEAFKEVVTYSGILLTHSIQESGILTFINALLMFVGDVLKGIAESTGAIQSFGGADPFASTTEGALDAAEATDQLNGKLLDFDKFRSLSGQEQTDIAIDENLLSAFSKYSSILENANIKARELANSWKIASDLFDESGAFNIETWEEINNQIKSLGETLLVIAGIKIVSKIATAIKEIDRSTSSIKLFKSATNIALYGGIYLIIYALNDLIGNWDEMSTSMKIAKISLSALGVALVTWSVLSKIATSSSTAFTTALKLQRIAATSLAIGGIALLISNISMLAGNWDKMKTWEKVVGVFGAVGAAALAAAAAIAAFHGSWTLGTGVVAIVGALAAITAAFTSFKASTREIGMYANGGLPDKGTMFLAGEAGAEIVYNTPNGQSGVANVQQIAQATYNGTIKALNDWWGGSGAKGDIPHLREANPSGLYEAVTGVAKSYGNTWKKA